jgi:hypothetical protein
MPLRSVVHGQDFNTLLPCQRTRAGLTAASRLFDLHPTLYYNKRH